MAIVCPVGGARVWHSAPPLHCITLTSAGQPASAGSAAPGGREKGGAPSTDLLHSAADTGARSGARGHARAVQGRLAALTRLNNFCCQRKTCTSAEDRGGQPLSAHGPRAVLLCTERTRGPYRYPLARPHVPSTQPPLTLDLLRELLATRHSFQANSVPKERHPYPAPSRVQQTRLGRT